AEHEAETEHGNAEKDGVAQAGRGQLQSAETADHGHVDDTHDLRSRFRRSERQSEGKQPTQFGTQLRRAHGRGILRRASQLSNATPPMGRGARSTRGSRRSRRVVGSMNICRWRMQCTELAKKSIATTPKKTIDAGVFAGNGDDELATKSS